MTCIKFVNYKSTRFDNRTYKTWVLDSGVMNSTLWTMD